MLDKGTVTLPGAPGAEERERDIPMQPRRRPALAEVGAVARPAILIGPGVNPGCRGVEMDVATEWAR